MAESARNKTPGPDPLQDINLRLSRSLKGAFRQNLIEALALGVTAALVFWLLSASDDHIGTKLLLVTLILSILSGRMPVADSEATGSHR
jgi:hypothetical protein